MSKVNTTNFGEDVAIVVGTVTFLEVVKWAFGTVTAFTVAFVVLILVVAFLYRVGAKK